MPTCFGIFCLICAQNVVLQSCPKTAQDIPRPQDTPSQINKSASSDTSGCVWPQAGAFFRRIEWGNGDDDDECLRLALQPWQCLSQRCNLGQSQKTSSPQSVSECRCVLLVSFLLLQACLEQDCGNSVHYHRNCRRITTQLIPAFWLYFTVTMMDDDGRWWMMDDCTVPQAAVRLKPALRLILIHPGQTSLGNTCCELTFLTVTGILSAAASRSLHQGYRRVRGFRHVTWSSYSIVGLNFRLFRLSHIAYTIIYIQ